jgi:hypothetical protein
MGEGGEDAAFVQVLGAGLHVAGALLQDRVIVRVDPEAEHVHLAWLARKACCELHRDEEVGAIGEPQRAVDGVVVGDRDEVHPPTLGQLVDRLGVGRALTEQQRLADLGLGESRRGRVTVHVDPGHRTASVAAPGAARVNGSRTGGEIAVNRGLPLSGLYCADG